MRVLMTTTGYVGHALPMVPFARALMRAGTEVRMVGPRSRGHFLTRLGLPYFGIYDSPEEAIHRVGVSTFDMPFKRANRRVVATGFGNLEARAAVSSVLDTVDSWRPDVVIRESYEFAAIIATELRSIPLCCVSLGLDDSERWIAERVSDPLAVLRADHGLPKEAHTPPEPYLTLMPGELEAPGTPFAIARLRFCAGEPAGEPLAEPSWAA